MCCPSCRRTLPPDAHFCPACGAPCTTTRTTASRKIVTLLFCDLVGSTALSAALDPEILRSVTLRYFELMRQQIEDRGGTVEKFIGDAVMAVFGVPAAREDDARRALAAALGMKEALRRLNAELYPTLGVRLHARIGVNTGRVVTGSDVSTRQALVSGEVVNVAARLEQNAGTDEILIGPDTLRAAGSGVVTDEVGPLHLKGKTEPVTAHRLLALRDDAQEGLHRPDGRFVGRGVELRALDRAFALARTERRGQLLLLCGEAGQGKTRLLREWLRKLSGFGTTPVLGTGRCRPQGEQASLHPLADAVRSLLTARRPDGPPPPQAAVDLLGAGLLHDGTPTPTPEDTCAALVDLLAAVCGPAPGLLVLDDCHSAAPALVEFLERLMHGLDGTAVLVVLAGRPELMDLRPGLAERAVVLGGLPEAESLELATELTEVAAHGSEGLTALVERASGNPLHLEQLLACRGELDTDDVPVTLQALIGARLDALDPAERRVVDLACVLGREFAQEDLLALDSADPADATDAAGVAASPGAGPAEARHAARGTDPGRADRADTAELRAALARLGRRRLIATDQRPLRFASGLVQEVAYACLAKQARADRHQQAAGLPSVRGQGLAAVGGHLERAYRYRAGLGLQGPRTGDLRLAAADTLAQAGARAAARTDPAWASDLLARAVDLYRPGESAGTPAARRLGEALSALGRGAEARTLLADVAAGTANPVEAAHARLSLAVLGQDEQPAAAARAALPVFERAADDLGQARACLRLAQQQQTDGQFQASHALLDRAVDHAVRADGGQELAAALGALAVSLWRGPAPVTSAVARCNALLAAHGNSRPAVRVTINCPLAVLLALQGDLDAAARSLADAERVAERLGYVEAEVFLPFFAATVASLGGDRHGAQRMLDTAAGAARRLGETGLLRSVLLDTARLRLDHGRTAAAVAALDELGAHPTGRSPGAGTDRTAGTDPAAAPSEERRPSAVAADADGLRGRIAARYGHRETAERLLARALAAAGATDSPIVQATALLDHARTALLLGRPGEAARAADAARQRFAAKGHRPGSRAAEMLAAHAQGKGTMP
ncbi:adenylate/guanylate cyclase domain-containing protein [Streptacidiphilus anmyonensis]|uniref:adenylate/guanylate cyclase domain-containing protein n=1 Tax=Streptacidiphilus anmyonensis TaxID=405782 RepID=UPI0005A73660|nr:adenylate/guanylate cyclase domain-containing protein [Streptacidiphilus anmyonensis]